MKSLKYVGLSRRCLKFHPHCIMAEFKSQSWGSHAFELSLKRMDQRNRGKNIPCWSEDILTETCVFAWENKKVNDKRILVISSKHCFSLWYFVFEGHQPSHLGLLFIFW
jgi:hypothetical protein